MGGDVVSKPRETTRRRLLALLGASGAAVVATQLSRDEALAGHDGTNIMHLGVQNDAPAGSVTQINGDLEGATLILLNNGSGGALACGGRVNIGVDVDDDALFIDNQNTGEIAGGISATARGSHAIEGLGLGGATGVIGESETGVGGEFSSLFVGGPATIVATVDGTQGDTLFVENRLIGEGGLPGGAISATSHGAHGVEGVAFPTELLDPEGEPQLGIGVRGVSLSAEGGFGEGPGCGVDGLSGTGIGVLGETRHGTGVEARSEFPDGFALVVRGKSLFSTAGSAVIPAGQNSVFVANADVAGDSHISVTLVSDPGPRAIRWVERDEGSGFAVHLSPAPLRQRPETHLTYLIIGPFD